MLRHTLDLIAGFPFAQTILVTVPAISEQVDTGAQIVINETPETGLASSVRLGVLAAEPGNSLIFFPGDQPLLDRKTISALLDADDGASIVYPQGSDGTPRSPTLFAPCFRAPLLALTGDEGGRAVRRSNPQACRPMPISDANLLLDVDTLEDYRNIRAIYETEDRL